MEYVVRINDIEEACVALGGQILAPKEIQVWIMQNKCEGQLPNNYRNLNTYNQTIQRIIENYCGESLDYNSGKFPVKFKRLRRGVYQYLPSGMDFNDNYEVRGIDDAQESLLLDEGAVKQILVNSYERNSAARRRCIEIHKCRCNACGFDYQDRYGDRGNGYIQVHHIVPLSSIKKSYEVDPEKDLIPLCANCHAMVHRYDPPLGVEQLKGIINKHEKLNAV
jgi:hypothetical protein